MKTLAVLVAASLLSLGTAFAQDTPKAGGEQKLAAGTTSSPDTAKPKSTTKKSKKKSQKKSKKKSKAKPAAPKTDGAAPAPR